MTRAQVVTLAALVVVACWICFAVGYHAAKGRYECHLVGQESATSTFRTDTAVYNICKP